MFPIPYSLLPTPYSLLPTPDSRLPKDFVTNFSKICYNNIFL
ncbi:hypothetical protein [Moorena producens]|nr:hypothetical protein [Moorena producens]